MPGLSHDLAAGYDMERRLAAGIMKHSGGYRPPSSPLVLALASLLPYLLFLFAGYEVLLPYLYLQRFVSRSVVDSPTMWLLGPAMFSLPIILQPFLSLCSDSFPLVVGRWGTKARRRPWIFLASLSLSVSIQLMTHRWGLENGHSILAPPWGLLLIAMACCSMLSGIAGGILASSSRAKPHAEAAWRVSLALSCRTTIRAMAVVFILLHENPKYERIDGGPPIVSGMLHAIAMLPLVVMLLICIINEQTLLNGNSDGSSDRPCISFDIHGQTNIRLSPPLRQQFRNLWDFYVRRKCVFLMLCFLITLFGIPYISDSLIPIAVSSPADLLTLVLSHSGELMGLAFFLALGYKYSFAILSQLSLFIVMSTACILLISRVCLLYLQTETETNSLSQWISFTMLVVQEVNHSAAAAALTVPLILLGLRSAPQGVEATCFSGVVMLYPLISLARQAAGRMIGQPQNQLYCSLLQLACCVAYALPCLILRGLLSESSFTALNPTPYCFIEDPSEQPLCGRSPRDPAASSEAPSPSDVLPVEPQWPNYGSADDGSSTGAPVANHDNTRSWVLNASPGTTHEVTPSETQRSRRCVTYSKLDHDALANIVLL